MISFWFKTVILWLKIWSPEIGGEVWSNKDIKGLELRFEVFPTTFSHMFIYQKLHILGNQTELHRLLGQDSVLASQIL